MSAHDGAPTVFPGLTLTKGIVDLIDSELAASETTGSPAPPNPFGVGELRAFVDWLTSVPAHSSTGLPRHLQAVFDEREDLQQTFPEVRSGILERFAWWVRTAGRAEHSSIRLLGHEVPPSRVIPNQGRRSEGCDVVGFFTAEHGVGEAGRLLVSALRTAEVDVTTINYTDTASRQLHPYDTDDVSRHRVLIAALNADQLAVAHGRLGADFFRDRYVVGQWFWELEKAPKWYQPAYRVVDELWAPTRFIEDMLRRSVPKRIHVRHMPTPIAMPTVDSELTRASFGLDDRFMFLFVFDFMSVMKRKNPIGLIEAFTRAFAPGEGPVLVIKCINGDKRPKEYDQLMAEAGRHRDVVVLDRYFTRQETSTLISLCDCYVSLHRSEGLGLTCAEAMALGRPVIATGYSGNLDFMNTDNSVLVPWTRVRVGHGAEGYDPVVSWADPDLDVAAVEMRGMALDPARRAVLGRRAAADIHRNHSLAVTGARMEVRLREISESIVGR